MYKSICTGCALLALTLAGCSKNGVTSASDQAVAISTRLSGKVTDIHGTAVDGATVYLEYTYSTVKSQATPAKACSLLSFSITPYAGGCARLDWSDTLETESYQWTVERAVRADTLHYTAVFSLPAAGTTVGKVDYYYYDPDTAGVNNTALYYRIKDTNIYGLRTVRASGVYYYTRPGISASNGSFSLGNIPLDSLVPKPDNSGEITDTVQISNTVKVSVSKTGYTAQIQTVSLVKDTVNTVNFILH